MLLEHNIEKAKDIVETLNIKHIAIIMDGNRRWAKEKCLPSFVGHQKGVASLKTILKACNNLKISYLTVYAFSTENWKRKPEEVQFLMNLLATTMKNELTELNDNNVRIKFIGDLSILDKDLKQTLLDAEITTQNNTGVNLQIAFNYGARAELVNALRKIALKVKNNEINIDTIDENLIEQNLYTTGIPEPDLLIRTGGEKRISNYLLWQIAYSEIFVCEQYWPDFDEESLSKIICEFKERNRRFGK